LSRVLIKIFWIALVATSLDVETSCAQTGQTAAERGSPRLLFAEQDGVRCKIRYWHERAAEAVILARTNTCPERLFVDKSKQILFVIDEDEVRSIRIYPTSELDRTRLPELDYKNWLDQMSLRPDENAEYLPSAEKLRPVGVRFLDDGTLGIVLSLWMPADDEFQYLFKHDQNGWSIVASRWCDRWGCEDPTDTSELFHSENYFSTQDIRSWPENRMVWHPDLMRSKRVKYRNEQKHETSPGRYSGMNIEVGMQSGGSQSVLTSYVSPSEHSDTLHTLTVDLLLDSGLSKNLCKNQCLTSIVDHYILVHEFFGGRFELADLSTGETVFDNLSTAAWID
jgi:hypothetical protein